MELIVYCIYDNKTKVYNKPMSFISEDEAVENLRMYANTKEEWEDMQRIDYDLFKLGKYDTESGKFETEQPEHIMNLDSLVEKEK